LESRIQLKALRHSNVVPIEQIEPDSLFAIDKSLLKLGNKKRKREEEEENAAGKRTVSILLLSIPLHLAEPTLSLDRPHCTSCSTSIGWP
jgi:hypothetical protein